MNLPPDLQSALEATLSTTSVKSLAQAVEHLSQRYRTGHALSISTQHTFLHSEQDILAYAAYRLPATFAAISAALIQIRASRPDWHPRSLLDIGAGPGTATWATSQIWPDLAQATLYERNRQMISYGKQLMTHARSTVLKQATWRQADITEVQVTPVGSFDLVIAAYMLGELPLSLHSMLIEKLWASTTDTLLLIEPGTPKGFSLIRTARAQLLAQGAHMLAPCPHREICPMPEHEWCHFSQRITRTRLQRSVKGAELSYEDEKFSYCVLSKQYNAATVGRVTRHPQKRSGHIHLELCTLTGLRSITATRSQRDAYREAHDIQWGDAIGQSLTQILNSKKES